MDSTNDSMFITILQKGLGKYHNSCGPLNLLKIAFLNFQHSNISISSTVQHFAEATL